MNVKTKLDQNSPIQGTQWWVRKWVPVWSNHGKGPDGCKYLKTKRTQGGKRWLGVARSLPVYCVLPTQSAQRECLIFPCSFFNL